MTHSNLRKLVDANSVELDVTQRIRQDTVETSANDRVDCIVGVVDCDTKESYSTELVKGESLAYSTWSGGKCVDKTYDC